MSRRDLFLHTRKERRLWWQGLLTGAALILFAQATLAAPFALRRLGNLVNLKDLTVLEESVVIAAGEFKGWSYIKVSPPGADDPIIVYCPVKMAPKCNLVEEGQLVKKIRGYLATMRRGNNQPYTVVVADRVLRRKR